MVREDGRFVSSFHCFSGEGGRDLFLVLGGGYGWETLIRPFYEMFLFLRGQSTITFGPPGTG